MKRVLITGTQGYIGASFRAYLGQFPETYAAECVSLRGEDWKERDFSPYDSIVHAAGLAHIRETAQNAPLYDEINRDLTIAVAQKAKREGVGQFVFLSSMSVYGVEEGEITPDTPPHPKSRYGKSKLEAERMLQAMESEEFAVAILRPPMVYGPGCKGNYRALVKLAEVLPVCPKYENRRSMISIERLCADLKETVDRRARGVFCPQDPAYVCTCDMICAIAAKKGRHLRQTRLLNFAPALLKRCTRQGKKAFGDLTYQRNITDEI